MWQNTNKDKYHSKMIISHYCMCDRPIQSMQIMHIDLLHNMNITEIFKEITLYSGAVHCPRYTGELNQPPMLGLVSWVWLGIHAGVTSTNAREEPLLTFKTYIEHHHDIILSLHLYMQVETSLCLHHLVYYTSV